MVIGRILFWGFLLIMIVMPGFLRLFIDVKKPSSKINTPKPASLPKGYKKSRGFDTYSKKTHDTKPGAMPHKHETNHYTSMCDASKLPKGYILLNGEPVRVAELEDK